MLRAPQPQPTGATGPIHSLKDSSWDPSGKPIEEPSLEEKVKPSY